MLNSREESAMKLFKGLLLMAVLFGGLVLGTQPVLASIVQVGGCLPGVKNYPNITAAVGAVTAGSTVKVCPGIYAEQVNIFIPLTLAGITSGNGDRAVIAAAGASLVSNIDSIFGDAVVAQVLADASGTVNISNITVDGTGNNQNNLVDIIGVFYASGTSGTMNGVIARQQNGNGRGYGIWVENGNSTLDSVTIANCEVHDVDSTAILIDSNQNPSTLAATVNGNMITGAPNGAGIWMPGATGSVTNNLVSDVGGWGILSTGNLISGNTVAGALYGIGAEGATVKSNKIFNIADIGIDLQSIGNTVQANTISFIRTGLTGAAINFECLSNAVSGNTISDAPIGINAVPSGQTVTNIYRNVDSIRTGC
jgi:hypothetical protein